MTDEDKKNMKETGGKIRRAVKQKSKKKKKQTLKDKLNEYSDMLTVYIHLRDRPGARRRSASCGNSWAATIPLSWMCTHLRRAST